MKFKFKIGEKVKVWTGQYDANSDNIWVSGTVIARYVIHGTVTTNGYLLALAEKYTHPIYDAQTFGLPAIESRMEKDI